MNFAASRTSKLLACFAATSLAFSSFGWSEAVPDPQMKGVVAADLKAAFAGTAAAPANEGSTHLKPGKPMSTLTMLAHVSGGLHIHPEVATMSLLSSRKT